MRKLSFEEMENVKGGTWGVAMACMAARYQIWYGSPSESAASKAWFNNFGYC